MATGIIYVMSSAVDGLIKIGKTGIDNFEKRMAFLESNGYRNVVGLKRQFAIELENYDEKEILLHSLFARSRVGNTELFSLSLNEVIQLLSSFEGKIIYPKENKNEVFEQATEAIETGLLPNGEFFMSVKLKDGRSGNATMIVKDGRIYLKKGSYISTEFLCKSTGWKAARELMEIDDGVLLTDFECNSPSMAAALVAGQNRNGWTYWKDQKGNPADVYRRTSAEEE